MMSIKKISAALIMLSAVVCTMTSCFEDKSTFGETIPVIIDTANLQLTAGAIEIANGTVLKLDPNVTQPGVASSDFSYSWDITISSSRTEKVFSKIGDKKSLEKLVTWPPSQDPYLLKYTVTDNRTGVDYIVAFKIFVVSRTGSGLIVADTKDGVNSDISFVRNKNVSSGYKGETVYVRDGYSLMNGQKMDGLINNMVYLSMGGSAGSIEKYFVYAMSDKTIQSVDPATYKVVAKFADLFLMPPVEQPFSGTLCANIFGFYIVYGEDLYHMNRLSGSLKAGSPTNYVRPGTDKIIPNKYFSGSTRQEVSFFDDKKGIIYCVYGDQYKIANFVPGLPASNSYDPTDLLGYTEIGSCLGRADVSYHILKAPDGNISYYGTRYRYDATAENDDLYESCGKFDASSCPQMADAIAFEGCDTRDVVYYATATDIYAGIVNPLGTINASKAFTVGAGEQITCMKLFREAWSNNFRYKPDNVVSMEQHMNQLMVATYNATTKEGKVYILNIEGANGSLVAPDDDHTLTGFGKITALATQGKQ